MQNLKKRRKKSEMRLDGKVLQQDGERGEVFTRSRFVDALVDFAAVFKWGPRGGHKNGAGVSFHKGTLGGIHSWRCPPLKPSINQSEK